jgi:Cdc6-like AAA superfamily ATPase
MGKTNNITTILGHKGSGKTQLSKYISQNISRLIVWDFLGQFECNDIANHTAKLEQVLKHSVYNVAVRLPEHYFPFICEFVKQQGNCTFLIDEIDMISSPSSIPKELDYLLRYGRHHDNGTGNGIDIIATARRPAEVHRNLTANSDDIYVYQTHEPRDLTYLSHFMRIDDIKSLTEFECLHYEVRKQSYTKERVPAEFVID